MVLKLTCNKVPVFTCSLIRVGELPILHNHLLILIGPRRTIEAGFILNARIQVVIFKYPTDMNFQLCYFVFQFIITCSHNELKRTFCLSHVADDVITPSLQKLYFAGIVISMWCNCYFHVVFLDFKLRKLFDIFIFPVQRMLGRFLL